MAKLFGRLTSGARRMGVALLDLVYPQQCMGCGAGLVASDASFLCDACRAALPLIGPWQCPHCGDELGPHAAGAGACGSCTRQKGRYFRGGVAVCRYETVARQMVLALKYGGDVRAAPWMGWEIYKKLQEKDWFASLDAVVPVPLHWRRRVRRRFNQSELLARAISRASGKTMLPCALRRTKNTVPQSSLEHDQRAGNVASAFRARQPGRIDGKVILLVDDVMTTCATAEACAKALKDAGAKKVYVAVYAR